MGVFGCLHSFIMKAKSLCLGRLQFPSVGFRALGWTLVWGLLNGWGARPALSSSFINVHLKVYKQWGTATSLKQIQRKLNSFCGLNSLLKANYANAYCLKNQKPARNEMSTNVNMAYKPWRMSASERILPSCLTVLLLLHVAPTRLARISLSGESKHK